MNDLMEIYNVAFFGHRYIDNMFLVEERLEKHFRRLMQEKQYVDFLVGRNGDFDQIVSSTVKRLKRSYRDDNSYLVLVLPYGTEEYFEEYYDEIEVSYEASKAHPKSAIQIRNREMVDRADLIICYIEEKHGGAYQTVKYAEKAGKTIINLFEEDDD